MIKKCLCFLALLLLSSQAFSQTVGTYTYKGKNYLVFPYRIGHAEEIPLLGYKIPDGEYIAFTVFNFKENFSFKSEKTHRLTDTTVVAAIFHMKDNMAEGPAVFYEHHYTDRGTESKKPFRQVAGELSHNLKTGVWAASIPGKKPDEYTTYKSGLKHGYYTAYNHKGQPELKEKYRDGDRCDTVFTFRNGKPELIYDLRDNEVPTESSLYDKGLELLDLIDVSVSKS